MERTTDWIKEFKNGNLNVKIPQDEIDDAKEDFLLCFNDALGWVDCDIITDEYCLSNYDMGCTLYSSYNDMCYVFPFSCIDDLLAGKMVKLYAHKPDEYDRECIADWAEEWGLEV